MKCLVFTLAKFAIDTSRCTVQCSAEYINIVFSCDLKQLLIVL